MTGFIFLIFLPFAASAVSYFIKNLRIQYLMSLGVAFLHLGTSFLIFIEWYNPDLPSFFSTDSLSKLFLLVLSNVYFWVTLISLSFLDRKTTANEEKSKRNYFLFLNFYLVANTAAILSNHFGMYWVAAEATTLSVAPLIYYYRSEEALEAMWKYLFLVSIGIAFAFIGILFLTLSAHGTPLEGAQLFFSVFVKDAAKLNPVWLKASFIFIFVGLSTKIGLAPMHYGDIDATSNAPSPIAALMSGSLRITALLGVLRIFQIMIPTSTHEFARVSLISGGFFSLIVAFILMFKVNNYKRMLAYSSVEHLGIITLGIATGGIAFIGAMYHVVYNSLNKMVLFFNAGMIHHRYGSRELNKVSAVMKIMPYTGWLFLISLFAISAIPPFGIFFSELMIFEGMLFSDKPWLLFAVMFLLLFIFINMSKKLLRMLYRKEENIDFAIEQERFNIVHFTSILLLIMLIAIAVFSPEILYKNILSISKDFGIRQ